MGCRFCVCAAAIGVEAMPLRAGEWPQPQSRTPAEPGSLPGLQLLGKAAAGTLQPPAAGMLQPAPAGTLQPAPGAEALGLLQSAAALPMAGGGGFSIQFAADGGMMLHFQRPAAMPLFQPGMINLPRGTPRLEEIEEDADGAAAGSSGAARSSGGPMFGKSH